MVTFASQFTKIEGNKTKKHLVQDREQSDVFKILLKTKMQDKFNETHIYVISRFVLNHEIAVSRSRKKIMKSLILQKTNENDYPEYYGSSGKLFLFGFRKKLRTP